MEIIKNDDKNINHVEESPSQLKSDENKGLDKEYGGRKNGLEPTRYNDWEKGGICVDF